MFAEILTQNSKRLTLKNISPMAQIMKTSGKRIRKDLRHLEKDLKDPLNYHTSLIQEKIYINILLP